MPERDWRKTVSRGIAVVVVLGSLGLVAMVVYAGGFGSVADAALRLSPLHAAVAVALIFVAWIADSLRYHVMARPIGITQPLRSWLSVALVNQFGAFAANVGAPAAAYVLSKRGVDGGTSFALSIAKQSLFVPAALGPAFVLMIVDDSLSGGTLFTAALWIAGAIGIGTLAGLVFVATWPKAAERILARTPLPAAATSKFVAAIAMIFRAPRTLIAAFGLALIYNAAIAAVAVVLLIGLGGDASAGVWASSFVFSAVSQSAPTPTGTGISEVAGVWLYAPHAAIPAIVALIILWRFLALQVPCVLGGLILARAARAPGQ